MFPVDDTVEGWVLAAGDGRWRNCRRTQTGREKRREEKRREEKSREASDSSSRFLEENKNNSGGARSTARTLRRRLLDWSFKECLFVYLGEHMCEEQKGELQDFCVSNKFRGLGFRVNERLVFLCFASIIR